MKSEDNINGSEFIIQGFSDIPKLQGPLCGIFLLLYILIICGNLTIIVLICKTPHLHTPMYIFLVNLSFIDIASTSNTLPKLLCILCTKQKTISFAGCIIQIYIFISLSCTEIFLLAFMAYDRYVAICHPLHYFILMPIRRCAGFLFISWAFGILDPIGHAVLISKMSFCLNNIIDHLSCDLIPLLLAACTDTHIVNMLNFIEGALFGISTFSLTLVSYIFIISTILKIKSTEGQRKAFSTCTAHLTCVIIFWGTLLFLYMRSPSSFSPKKDKYFFLLYIVFIPMSNPIIYSLKNEEVKAVLLKMKRKYL